MLFGLGRSSPPVIRPLRADKAEDCARLHAAGFAHPWSAEEIAALIASASTLAAAALDPASGRLRGFVLARLAADEAEILTIAVDPAARGKGVGGRCSPKTCDRPPTPARGRCSSKSTQDNAAGARALQAPRLRQGRRARRLLSAQGRRAGDRRRHAQGAAMSAAAAAGDRPPPAAATTLARLAVPHRRARGASLPRSVRRGGSPRASAGASAKGFRCCFQRLLCAGLAVRVRRHGTFSSAPKQLIVANHVSWLDIPVLGSLEPMSFLAKKEIGDHPVGRELVAMQGVVYVDRRRRSCIPAVNARMVETMRAGSPVVLFAEATTGDGNRLLRFRSSHFEAIRLAACGGQRGPRRHPAGLSRLFEHRRAADGSSASGRASPGTAT